MESFLEKIMDLQRSSLGYVRGHDSLADSVSVELQSHVFISHLRRFQIEVRAWAKPESRASSNATCVDKNLTALLN